MSSAATETIKGTGQKFRLENEIEKPKRAHSLNVWIQGM
jgi:hypothetical protein